MKVTSPWRRLALPVCLAAGSLVRPVFAEGPVPLPVPVPVASSEPVAEPTPAEPKAEEPTPAEPKAAEVPAPEPLQAVELTPSLAAPPAINSRLAKVKVTDETTNEPAEGSVNEEVPVSEDSASDETKLPEKAANIVTELIKERYPSGSVKLEREVAQDREGNFVLHGAYRQYDERGALICEGTHEQGQPSGTWKRYYAAGAAPLFTTSPYKEFQAPFTSQASFENGQLHGKWTITDLKQRRISEIEFVDGQRHGKAAWYYPNGAILSQATYDRGRVHGDVTKWGPDASLLGKETYTHGRKLAPKVDYYDGEHKRSEVFVLHAPLVVKTFDNFNTATLAVFEQRGADEKFGPFRVWHPTGQLARQGEFRYNLPVGKTSWFYANGQKQMEGTYVDGKQEGTWTWWHQNGLKQIEGDYLDGVAIGKWSWWKEDGKLAQRTDMAAAKVANIPAPLPDAEEDTIRR
jgi:antitoxin component YwqK of YwqJK toxin-antitoxin module